MQADKKLKKKLSQAFAQYSENAAIEVMSLATADGFPVHTFAKPSQTFDEDSLSAAASTLHSVSNAVAKKILNKKFKVAFIEAEQGNVAFVDIDIADSNFVLVMSADQTMNIANLRLLITRLAGEICQFSTPTVAVS